MELQQQLPLKAVGACMQLPNQVTGVHKVSASEYCMHAHVNCVNESSVNFAGCFGHS